MLDEDQWRIYQDKENVWHWKLMTNASKILKTSANSYKNRNECLENARKYGYLGN